MLDRKLLQNVIKAQRNEISEALIYETLSRRPRLAKHAETLRLIAADERRHYGFFQSLSGQEVAPDRFKVRFVLFLARCFGLNFALRLMEGGEDLAQDVYGRLREISPKVDEIIRDEKEHEGKLLDLIDEELLAYVGSVVLGLNDALVELTGALVGFTLALQRARLIAVVGLITGIAASMSMAAAEYLSTKHEDAGKDPLKACIYTGITYILTVAFLVLPYFLLTNIYACLAWVISGALLIVFVFTFYISVAKGLNFRRRFLEMAGLSLSIAAINFGIGLVVRRVFGVDI